MPQPYMTVKQAREAAREWMAREAVRIPGFRGAYTGGSTNWLPDDAVLSAASDVDVMVVVADGEWAGRRQKFLYGGVLLEASYLEEGRFASAEQVLSDYHLAPGFRESRAMVDPLGRLTALREEVVRNYAKRAWVTRRCAHAHSRVLATVHSPEASAMACLFAAGITTHVLLVAGLKNPTVRKRYIAVRELLAECGRLEFQETLLELLGAARIGRERAGIHLQTVTALFDEAVKADRQAFPFACDISELARPIAIEGCAEMIACGFHREAMFWIAVTDCRCRLILGMDASGEVEADLGLASAAERGRRCAAIESALPGVWEVAEAIAAGNPEMSQPW